MPYVFTGLKEIEDMPVVGEGDCVTLIKEKVPGLKGAHTSNWCAGAKVVGSQGIARGTAIATFENGRYPARPQKKHAAIFLAHAGKSIWVLDQWKSPSKRLVQKRLIQPGRPGVDDPSNSAETFFVIELCR